MARRRRRRRARAGDWAALAVVVALLVWAFAPGVGWDLFDLGGQSGVGAAQSDGAWFQRLRALPVRGPSDEASVPEYSRDEFGQRWADTDHNGCDTRNDVLARDLARPVFKPGTHDCVVLSGTLAEPYTGATVEFERGQDTSQLVQIDHVVALADAWRSGAWQWDGAERQEFANDMDNLLAVDGAANERKSAASADQWLPPNKAFRCEYVQRQIDVKTTYGLSVTQAERDAMVAVLGGCS